MAQPAEQKKQYHVSKAFKGLNTKANRTAIEDDEFSMLLNAQPIGSGNLKIIPGSLPATANAANVVMSGNITYMESVELLGKTYMGAFLDTGASQFYDVNNQTLTTIASANTFSTTNVTITQFNNTDIIIGDPTRGLFVYDGNVTVQLGAGGAIGMLNVGSGYTTPPAVIVSAPDQAGGQQATAEAVLVGSTVGEVIWSRPGTGYTKSPTITISGGGGTNAQAIASLLSFRTGQVYYQVLSGGQNYTSATIHVSGGGGDNTANATAIVSNGQIINVIPTALGNSYTNTSSLVVTITGDGSNAQVAAFVESNVVTSVATYAGRVFVAQGRQLLYSGATGFNDFVGISAGSLYVTDSTLHGNILGLLTGNNFLYFNGDDSFNVISDVLVNSSGTTNLTNTNIGASIGTRRTGSLFPYYRYIMFQNDYGVYGIIGSTTVKLSDALDGLYPYIDFTKPVTGGQVLINNILCACFNFYLSNYTGLTSGYYQAVFFDKRWFLSNQGNINYVAGAPVGGQLGIFGASGPNLYRLYIDSASPISSITQTALWPLNDPIRDKQTTKAAIEATFPGGAGTLNVTVDNPYNSSAPYVLTSYVTWTNFVNAVIPWHNSNNATVQWTGGLSGYQLYLFDPQQAGMATSGQKYVGLTITSNTPTFSFNTFELEYELRARF